MDIARDIAINMGIFTDDEITLIECIALFHDNTSALAENNIIKI